MTSRGEEIRRMLASGATIAETAAAFGVVPNTVRYHAGRGDGSAPTPASRGDGPVRERLPATRDRVAELLAEGLSRAQVAVRLGVTKSTVSYYARRLGHKVDARFGSRIDWPAVQAHHDAGHDRRACRAAFGFSDAAWYDAIERGALVARAARPIEALCVEGVPRGRTNLKRRLVASGLKDGCCESCGLREWNGRPLTVALHHVNGDGTDNRLENLQLLCPNCHSQTDNFAGRKRRAA